MHQQVAASRALGERPDTAGTCHDVDVDISGYVPPYKCMAKGFQSEATHELERQDLESGAITRDLRLCDEHADQFQAPGSSVLIGGASASGPARHFAATRSRRSLGSPSST